MGLKELKPADRINFLRLFVSELMISIEAQDPSKKIEVEKIRQKFLNPVQTPEKAFEAAINTPIFEKPIYANKINEIKFIIPEQKIQEKSREEKIQELINIKRAAPGTRDRQASFFGRLRKPIFPKQSIAPQDSYMHHDVRPSRPIRKPLQKQEPTASTQLYKSQYSHQHAEQYGQLSESGLGRIAPLLQDLSIQAIECRGAEKNILVKRYNKIKVTRIVLTKQEIEDIINTFSQKARIPVVGGILKAAVGDLIISAITSEYVGSRFIISKITPYNLMEN